MGGERNAPAVSLSLLFLFLPPFSSLQHVDIASSASLPTFSSLCIATRMRDKEKDMTNEGNTGSGANDDKTDRMKTIGSHPSGLMQTASSLILWSGLWVSGAFQKSGG
jgi:hypothetical protein